MRENVLVQFKVWHPDGEAEATAEKIRTRLVGFDEGIGSIDAITIDGDLFAQVRLTDAEHKLLALFAARGDRGIASYLPGDPNQRIHGMGDLVDSLVRFGYVILDPDPAKKVRVITPAGLARIMAYRQGYAARHYRTCLGCVQTNCVCSYSMACLATTDPVCADDDVAHASLGCHGTHD
jgi:hypothetical protein